MKDAAAMGVGAVVAAAALPWIAPDRSQAAGMLLLALVVLARTRHKAMARAWIGMALVYGSFSTTPQGPWHRGPMAAQVRVTSCEGLTVVGRAERIRPLGRAWRETAGHIAVVGARERCIPGQTWLVFGEAVAPGPQRLPGAPQPAVQARRSKVRTFLRARAQTVWATPPTGDAPAGLLGALVTGDRSRVDPEQLQLLRDTGTAHLLAISGFHVGLVGLMALVACRLLCGLWAVVRPSGGPVHLSFLLAACLTALFAWSVGLPLSAQRAALMFLAVAIARTWGRRLRPLDALGAIATGLLVLHPGHVGTISFQLSFGAVFGLLCWGTKLSSLWERPPRWATGPYKALCATLAATAGTLPASAWWFQQLPPTSPLANLVAMPMTGWLVVPSAFAAHLLPDPVAEWAETAGLWSVDLMLSLLRPLQGPMWHPAVTGTGALLLWLALALHRHPTVALLLATFALGPRPWPTEPTATFLDVGQGSAALLQWPDGRAWLIDGGPDRREVVQWLRRQRIRSLERVVVTHPARDHEGGLPAVLEGVEVGSLHLHDPAGHPQLARIAAARGIPLEVWQDGRLHPLRRPCHGTNDCSLTYRVDVGPWRLLAPGDLEAPGEAALLAGGMPLRAELLWVGHHGSATSTGEPFLQAVDPRLAIVPAPAASPYGHPHPQVWRRLRRSGAAVVSTGVHGTTRLVGTEPPLLFHHHPVTGWWRGVVPSGPQAADFASSGADLPRIQ